MILMLVKLPSHKPPAEAYSIWKYQQFPFSAYEKRRSETKKGSDQPHERLCK
jgi:hypothetical protein